MKHHNYSLTELEEMWPFEREIYIILLQEWIREQKEQQRLRKNKGM